MSEGRGERATGTANTIYDLSSVLYHALQGGASYDQYIRDAEAAGDEELIDFFRRVRDEDSMRADEARTLLAERTPTTGRVEEGTPAGAPPRAEEKTLPRQEETAGRTGRARGEDRGLLDRAADALRGQDSLLVPRREETGRRRKAPRGPRGDEPL